MIDLKKMIEDAWDNRTLLSESDYINAINTVIERLDKGEIRVAELIGTRSIRSCSTGSTPPS